MNLIRGVSDCEASDWDTSPASGAPGDTGSAVPPVTAASAGCAATGAAGGRPFPGDAPAGARWITGWAVSTVADGVPSSAAGADASAAAS